jgi:hypothetical protein
MAAAYIMLSIAGLLLPGCQKAPGIPSCTPTCQILEIKGNLGFEDGLIDSFFIDYNNKKNPVSLSRSFIGTSAPNYLFRYDQKGRITDFCGFYVAPVDFYKDSIDFDTWHRYHYDARNRIILDTTYEFGIVGPGFIPRQNPNRTIPDVSVRNISTYKYDNHDRIIKSTDTYGRDTVSVTRLFTYNQSGNLEKIEMQQDGTSTFILYGSYDNRINYHRTNIIWQFLDRDYSTNNMLPVDTYNGVGLPTSIQVASHAYRTFATEYFTHAVIKYSCN